MYHVLIVVLIGFSQRTEVKFSVSNAASSNVSVGMNPENTSVPTKSHLTEDAAQVQKQNWIKTYWTHTSSKKFYFSKYLYKKQVSILKLTGTPTEWMKLMNTTAVMVMAIHMYITVVCSGLGVLLQHGASALLYMVHQPAVHEELSSFLVVLLLLVPFKTALSLSPPSSDSCLSTLYSGLIFIDLTI